jgi:hypothetical protein
MIVNLADLQAGDVVTLMDTDVTFRAVIITPGDELTVSQLRSDHSIPEEVQWLGIVDLIAHRFQGPRFFGQGGEVLQYALVAGDDEQDKVTYTTWITMLEVVRSGEVIVKWPQ